MPGMHGVALSLHVIGFILWMGGLFLLAGHLGQHAGMLSERGEGAEPDPNMMEFEKKAYYLFALPGLLLTVGAGLWLLLGFNGGAGFYLSVDDYGGPTFHIKLTLVVILIAIDQLVHVKMRNLHNTGTGKRALFMASHGLTGLLFIVIVFMMQMVRPI